MRRIVAVVASEEVAKIFRANPGEHFRITNQYPYFAPDIVRTGREENAKVIIIEAPPFGVNSHLFRVAENIASETKLGNGQVNIVLIASIQKSERPHAQAYLYHVTDAGVRHTENLGEILPEMFWQSVLKTAILLDLGRGSEIHE